MSLKQHRRGALAIGGEIGRCSAWPGPARRVAKPRMRVQHPEARAAGPGDSPRSRVPAPSCESGPHNGLLPGVRQPTLNFPLNAAAGGGALPPRPARRRARQRGGDAAAVGTGDSHTVVAIGRLLERWMRTCQRSAPVRRRGAVRYRSRRGRDAFCPLGPWMVRVRVVLSVDRR